MRLRFNAMARKVIDRDRAEPTADLARVGNWLQPEAILLDAEARDAEQVLQIAAATIGRTHRISAQLVFDALQRRERAASTALGAGVAIPHARLPGLERPVTVFMRLRKPVPFGAADGLPVACVLAIIVPKDGADGDHLKMLSLIAELFSARGFRKQIGAASDTAAAEAAFRSGITGLVGKPAWPFST